MILHVHIVTKKHTQRTKTTCSIGEKIQEMKRAELELKSCELWTWAPRFAEEGFMKWTKTLRIASEIEMTKREDIIELKSLIRFCSPLPLFFTQVGLRFERLEEALSANFNSLQEQRTVIELRSRRSFDAGNMSLGWGYSTQFLSNLFW